MANPDTKILRIGRNKLTGLWQARCEPCRIAKSGTFSRTVFSDIRDHVTTDQHAESMALWNAGLRRRS